MENKLNEYWAKCEVGKVLRRVLTKADFDEHDKEARKEIIKKIRREVQKLKDENIIGDFIVGANPVHHYSPEDCFRWEYLVCFEYESESDANIYNSIVSIENYDWGERASKERW